MKLGAILERIEELNESDVVFAEKPWSLDARAEIGQLDRDYKVPDSILSQGLSYFLEVSTAREVMEVFGGVPPTKQEICSLLLFYAENDAFPEWVYER